MLSKTLYNIINYRVSVDVAFKRACKGVRRLSLSEREKLYTISRDFISSYLRVKCFLGSGRSYSSYARVWLDNLVCEQDLPAWCRYGVDVWLYERLYSLMGDEVHELLRALERRVLWVRINTLKTSEERVLRSLESEGVEYVIDMNYPYLIRIIKTSKPVRLLKPVKNFELIPQDKASIAVVEALKPEPGEEILDMTFAPGMKTSLIMMHTDNRAKVVAVDISYRRSLMGRQLMSKLGVDLSRVQVISSDARDLQLRCRFSKVLLDAPCSNSGAISKDPGLKITLTPSKITYYARIQRDLIRKALSLGETVVYSTCSLMPEEGEEIIDLIANSVRLYRAVEWAGTGYPSYKTSEDVMRLYPHRHLTEGFFISFMEIT
ncbi:MAG: RsmB/NOP family class I SAM-dependent RNA methyltransferase [Zestosphaera sp.]